MSKMSWLVPTDVTGVEGNQDKEEDPTLPVEVCNGQIRCLVPEEDRPGGYQVEMRIKTWQQIC